MAIIRSDVATGLRIKGAEGFMDYGPPGPPPPPPRPLRLSDAKAVLHWLDRESRFWARQRRAAGPVWPEHSLAISAPQALLITACALARAAVRAASLAAPEGGAIFCEPAAGITPSEPSRKRSAPSTTTVSPAFNPSRMATLSPSCTPSLTLR